MRRVLLATTIVGALVGTANADTVLTLSGPINGNIVGPQSSSNPCIIAGQNAGNRVIMAGQTAVTRVTSATITTRRIMLHPWTAGAQVLVVPTVLTWPRVSKA